MARSGPLLTEAQWKKIAPLLPNATIRVGRNHHRGSPRQKPVRVIADKAYDSDRLRERLRLRGIELICPHRRNRQGWHISGITTFQQGFPLDVADLSDPSGGCQAGDFNCWDGPNQVGPVHYMNPRAAGHTWFSASSFAEVACAPNCPAASVSPTSVLAYGNAPRDPIRSPGLNNWDFVLYKDTTVTESMRVQLRMEAYNVSNHTQFDPNGVGTDIISSTFGTIFACPKSAIDAAGGEIHLLTRAT
jgi:hypothetical protein